METEREKGTHLVSLRESRVMAARGNREDARDGEGKREDADVDDYQIWALLSGSGGIPAAAVLASGEGGGSNRIWTPLSGSGWIPAVAPLVSGDGHHVEEDSASALDLERQRQAEAVATGSGAAELGPGGAATIDSGVLTTCSRSGTGR